MAAVASCGIVSGRRAATANALCVAVTAMLVADPTAVDDLGLQLSALATAGLVLWQAPLSERLAALPSPLRDGLSTTIAATAPTLPVIAGAFGRLSLISPLANLVLVPSFPLLMLAGAATSVIGAASLDAARPLALLAWASASALRTGVETFAALPLASLTVPAGALTGSLVAMFEVGAVLAARRASPPRSWRAVAQRVTSFRLRAPRAMPPRGGIAAALLLVVALALAFAAWPASAGSVRVVALDVGQGDAYLVDVGGALALIDGGPDPARLLDELGATLPPWHRRIDVVALTHAHTDHADGLIGVLERYDVGLAIEPLGLNPSPLTDLWSAALAKRGVERRAVHAGQRVQLGAATIDVLAPADDLVVATPSLVLRVESGAFSALFTGDAVDDALGRLLAHPERLRSRVYVPPHHGAQTPYASALRVACATGGRAHLRRRGEPVWSSHAGDAAGSRGRADVPHGQRRHGGDRTRWHRPRRPHARERSSSSTARIRSVFGFEPMSSSTPCSRTRRRRRPISPRAGSFHSAARSASLASMDDRRAPRMTSSSQANRRASSLRLMRSAWSSSSMPRRSRGRR